MRLFSLVSFAVLLSVLAPTSRASELSFITFNEPLLQSRERRSEAWGKIAPDRKKQIEQYLLSLGLSSTGSIYFAGVFRHYPRKDHEITLFQFQQFDLQGTRLFWSVLVDPDAMSAQVIYHVSGDKVTAQLSPMLNKQ
jgi:hypothetical protein